jgi:hypothetical protein
MSAVSVSQNEMCHHFDIMFCPVVVVSASGLCGLALLVPFVLSHSGLQLYSYNRQSPCSPGQMHKVTDTI